MRKWMTVILTIALTGCLAGCSGNSPKSGRNPGKDSMKSAKSAQQTPIQLTLWTDYSGWDSVIDAFHQKYPAISVRVKVFSNGEYVSQYLKALANGEAPDIMVIDSNDFGNFTALGGLQDLLQPPYRAGKYKKDFSPSFWRQIESFDGKKLLGFPLDEAPNVTFYREDILQHYGFPSEPEKLAEYMKNPDQWLYMARQLAKHHIYLAQSAEDGVWLGQADSGIFDRKLNFTFHTAQMRELLGIGNTIDQDGLSINSTMWSDAGQQDLRDGKLAMVYSGSWWSGLIQSWAPEQAGEWRETRLPFGLNSIANADVFTLPVDGKHKEAAWKFIQYDAIDWAMQGRNGNVPSYLPAQRMEPNDASYFLGGQKTYSLNRQLTNQTAFPFHTPLDAKANDIWNNDVNSGIANRVEPEKILQQAQKDIKKSLGDRMAILKSFLPKTQP